MNDSLLSGRFGEPEGGRLLSQREKAALENLIRNEVILNQLIINEQTGGGSGEEDFARVDADGAIIVQTNRNEFTSSKLAVGTYSMVNATPLDDDGGEPVGAAHVTPQSHVAIAPEAQVINREWFVTNSPSYLSGSGVAYDPLKQQVWATDVDYNTDETFPDRIAVGSPFNDLPEFYISIPSGYPVLNRTKGSTLIVDSEYRLAFVQAEHTAGNPETTLIYSLDSPSSPVFDTFITIGGPNTCIITGMSSDYFLINRNGTLHRYARDSDGLPTGGSIGTYSGDVALDAGVKNLHTSPTTGEFWGIFSSPADWTRLPISGFTGVGVDAGAEGIANRLHIVREADNCIYFVTNGYEYIKKISMDSPYTVTTLNGSPYGSTLNAGTAPTTIKDIMAIRFTEDEQYIVAIRNGNIDTTFPYIYMIDPSNGDIVTAVELPSLLAGDNYCVEQIVAIGNYYVTIGPKHLQVINFQPAEEGTPISFVPPLFGDRIISTTETIVEFWHPKTLSKIDCAFHFRLSRDRS